MKINKIVLVLIVIIVLSPFFFIVIFSFSDFVRDAFNFGSIQSYRELIRESFRIKSFFFIIERSLLNAVFAQVLAFPFCYILFRYIKTKMRIFLLTLITLPFFINEVTRVFSWNYILGGQGIIYSILHLVNPSLNPISWLSNSEFSVRLVMLASTLPFSIFLNILVIANIENDILITGQDLGASNRFEFWRVVVPLSRMGIIGSWCLVFLFGLSMSTEVQLLGGANKQSLRIIINDLLSVSKISMVMSIGTIIVLIAVIILVILSIIRLSFKYEM